MLDSAFSRENFSLLSYVFVLLSSPCPRSFSSNFRELCLKSCSESVPHSKSAYWKTCSVILLQMRSPPAKTKVIKRLSVLSS